MEEDIDVILIAFADLIEQEYIISQKLNQA
jgi:hypothetical protein